MTHSMKLCPQPFEQISMGEKTIELRLNDEKRQKIKVGDTVLFTHTERAEKQLIAKVIGVHVFRDFAQRYKTLPLDKCGYSAAELPTANYQDMYAYYTPEQENRFGVVGIEIALCK